MISRLKKEINAPHPSTPTKDNLRDMMTGVVHFLSISMSHFISIAGNMGVGKTTLTEKLSERLGWKALFESNDENPYLADFYTNMTHWGFHSQLFFLSRHLADVRKLFSSTDSIIQDRSFYENAEIFARNLYQQGHISERDWRVYEDLYKNLLTLIPPPHLLVYLVASPLTLARRVQHRNRAYETNLSLLYLTELNTLYETWIHNFTACRVLRVDTDTVDLIHNENAFETFVEQLQKYLVSDSYKPQLVFQYV